MCSSGCAGMTFFVVFYSEPGDGVGARPVVFVRLVVDIAEVGLRVCFGFGDVASV